MTTKAEQVQRLVATLDQEVNEAEERLRLVQAEYEAAKETLVRAQRQRETIQQTFAPILGTATSETEPTLRTPSLQLVPALAGRRASANQLAEMTAADKLKHVLGDRTMTLEEIRLALKAAKVPMAMPKLSYVLSQSKHNVLGPDGEPMRDDKTGKLVKENTFISASRGSWRVAQPEDEPSVLTRTEAQLEMLKHRQIAST